MDDNRIIADWLAANRQSELAWERGPATVGGEWFEGEPNDFTNPAYLIPAMEAWMKSQGAILEFRVYFKEETAAFASEITVGEDTIAFKSNPSLAGVLRASFAAALEGEKAV